MTMVRSERWKLVHFLEQTYGQLFDLQADRGEVNNLWDDAAHAHVRQELIQVLCNWRIRSGLHTADFAAECR
jgi:arylsulfatase A-like enzyme